MQNAVRVGFCWRGNDSACQRTLFGGEHALVVQCVRKRVNRWQDARIMKIRISFSADADSIGGKIATCFIITIVSLAMVMTAYFLR